MEKYYEELKRFENNFGTAIRSNYTRNIVVKDRRRLNEIYNDLTGTDKRLPVTCRNCLLMMLQYLGKAYFEYKSREPEEEKEEEAKEVGQEPAAEEKPKRVRRKEVNSGRDQ